MARKDLVRIQHWETPQERGQDIGMWVRVGIMPGEGSRVRHGSGLSRQGHGKACWCKPQAHAAGGLQTAALSRRGSGGSNKIPPGVTLCSHSS